jgi:hypothetical protein
MWAVQGRPPVRGIPGPSACSTSRGRGTGRVRSQQPGFNQPGPSLPHHGFLVNRHHHLVQCRQNWRQPPRNCWPLRLQQGPGASVSSCCTLFTVTMPLLCHQAVASTAASCCPSLPSNRILCHPVPPVPAAAGWLCACKNLQGSAQIGADKTLCCAVGWLCAVSRRLLHRPKILPWKERGTHDNLHADHHHSSVARVKHDCLHSLGCCGDPHKRHTAWNSFPARRGGQHSLDA